MTKKKKLENKYLIVVLLFDLLIDSGLLALIKSLKA